MCVCVCVCVCEGERERERESLCMRIYPQRVCVNVYSKCINHFLKFVSIVTLTSALFCSVFGFFQVPRTLSW